MSEFKVMYKSNTIWYTKVFSSEKEAREFANHQWKYGAHIVELYSKIKCGYRLVKSAKCGMREAATRCGITMANDLIAELGDKTLVEM